VPQEDDKKGEHHKDGLMRPVIGEGSPCPYRGINEMMSDSSYFVGRSFLDEGLIDGSMKNPPKLSQIPGDGRNGPNKKRMDVVRNRHVAGVVNSYTVKSGNVRSSVEP
jgi:hypothetical protein